VAQAACPIHRSHTREQLWPRWNATRGGVARMAHAGCMPRPPRRVATNWGRVGSDSTTTTPCALSLALFHTMGDMMTVILRIDSGSNSDSIPVSSIS
jgi:hypothetical protein